MIDLLHEIDTRIFLLFNGVSSPFFDVFMTIFTGRVIWWPMYAAIIVVLWRAGRWPRMLFYLCAVLLAVAVADQLCAAVIRPAVERLRPSNPQNTLSELAYIVNEYRGGHYGFPSCHAANSFTMATFISLLVRRRGFAVFLIGWALINSYTRLYLGVHYPGDLIVGTLIGTAMGFIFYFATRWLAFRNINQSEITERCEAPLLPIPGTGINLSSIQIVESVGVITLVCICIVAAIASC